ncbi:hypothetical protein [Primorskyibacter sedentarius]|uniref:hypothetical protein n=1 Tax=Primorskyibacter sedentarius TaxID=745311 RepID=UPI001051898F|nr:hypothetical protein [Primorskyibacter sedentarius]
MAIHESRRRAITGSEGHLLADFANHASHSADTFHVKKLKFTTRSGSLKKSDEIIGRCAVSHKPIEVLEWALNDYVNWTLNVWRAASLEVCREPCLLVPLRSA